MQEQWKPITEYKGLYEVSNLGRVKSLNYGGTGKEQVLKPFDNGKGYLQVNLCKNGKVKNFLIHRLVAQAFIENSLNKPFINHLDCDRQNNCIDNLEWCTAEENMQYASKLGRMKGAEYLKKVSAEQRRMNGKKRSKPVIAINLKTGEEIYFNSLMEAARRLNLSAGNINDVLKGKYKQMKGYIFRYKDPI